MTETEKISPSFIDENHNAWPVRITIADAKRVREVLDENLTDYLAPEKLDELARDPILLVDVLFVVLKPLADERGIDDEAFGRSIGGDSIEAATNAFLEALVDFCPSQRDRRALARLLQASTTAKEAARDVIETRLASVTDEEIRRLVQREIETSSSGDPSTKPPGCLGLTQDPTACGNSCGCSKDGEHMTASSPAA